MLTCDSGLDSGHTLRSCLRAAVDRLDNMGLGQGVLGSLSGQQRLAVLASVHGCFLELGWTLISSR
jgi:hypothetical protein